MQRGGDRPNRFALVFGALVLAGLSLVAAGCAMDAQVLVRFSGESPMVVTETVKPEQSPYSVEGVTRRNGQVIGVNCGVTLVYDVREATGYAVLAQRYLLKLRSRPLRRGTAYKLDCMGPLIVELPVDASAIAATATTASGLRTALPTRAPVAALPLAQGKRLRPDPKTQFAVIAWQPTLAAGDYELELAFTLPSARPIREKAVYTASVSCGRSRYLQPILPPVTRMARTPAFTVRPSADAETLVLPRVAQGIRSYAEAKRTLSCVR